MIPALVLLLFFCPFGNDLYALPKAALACAAVFVAFWRNPPTIRPANVRPWIGLTVALGVSTFFSWDLGYSLVSIEHSRGLGLLQWAVCGLLFLYGCNVAADGQEVDDAVLYGGFITAGWTITQLVMFSGRQARTSTQGSPVLVGEMLAVCFPAAMRIHPALAGLFALGALAAECRSALIAMAAMTVYLFWRKA